MLDESVERVQREQLLRAVKPCDPEIHVGVTAHSRIRQNEPVSPNNDRRGRCTASGMRNLAFLLTSFLVACTVTQSQDLETSGMAVSIVVSADGTGGSNVSAKLSTDANALNSIELDSGDLLVVTVGTQSEDMSKQDLLGDISYQASFNGLDATGTSYDIALNRRSGFVSAPASIVTMPTQFNITAPSSSATFSRANDAITVTYDTTATGDPMTWSVSSGSCSSGPSGTVAGDSGSFTIAKNALIPSDAQQKNMTCDVTITLKRTRTGTVDSHYGYGGNITATQQRSVTFTSTP